MYSTRKPAFSANGPIPHSGIALTLRAAVMRTCFGSSAATLQAIAIIEASVTTAGTAEK
jgi:hypothetical protein